MTPYRITLVKWLMARRSRSSQDINHGSLSPQRGEVRGEGSELPQTLRFSITSLWSRRHPIRTRRNLDVWRGRWPGPRARTFRYGQVLRMRRAFLKQQPEILFDHFRFPSDSRIPLQP